MISGVILARNEEANIADCVQALRPHVTEIILIDMESTDRTVERARPIVDQILHHELLANFDCARNIAIPEARNEWLWFVDADERIPNRTGEVVNQLLRERGHGFVAINIPFKTYFCGKWIEHSGWWPGYTMPRVLKRGHFQFSAKLHGGVELSGREVRIPADPDLAIEHFSYNSIEHYIQKLNRYTSTEALQLREAGQSIDWRNAIGHMMHDLWMYYECNLGYLDGRHGWILAWLSGQYRWLSHAKLLDLVGETKPPGAALFPHSLSEVLEEMQRELERARRSRPILPLGVVFRSPIWDPSGYADEGRCIAKALSRTHRGLRIEEIPWSDSRCEIPGDERALLRALHCVQRKESNVTITNCIPSLVQPDPAAALNVLRTTFEVDRIPKSWLEVLERFDEIWVISKCNELAFVRSGVAPEKIRVVPSFLNTDIFQPEGPKIDLPSVLGGRFVFLSVFDWQRRKGWDVLLSAYCRAFQVTDGVGLLLKITRSHGILMADVRQQATQALKAAGEELSDRPDIAFVDEPYSTEQMAALYRAVDAFVLPSRGEGWGRPYMEAMASGLPTIGTGASGNIDFMNDDNSILIPSKLVDVPEEAANELSIYKGCQWFEPDLQALCNAMRTIVSDPDRRRRLGRRAREHVAMHHGIDAGQWIWEAATDAAEKRLTLPPIPPETDAQIRVSWEGELFAGHSFSNINEQLTEMFMDDDRFALAIDRKFYNPTHDLEHAAPGKYLAYAHRQLRNPPHVVIRHTFPPNWSRPTGSFWIHIQPWEFGHVPEDWIAPLQNDVNEIWVPSNYVKRVYTNSGIAAEKIRVIPWGVETKIFSPGVASRFLPTSKAFRFLFVGGTIPRKGFDRVLQAYLEEFSPEEDVALVVKDIGADTFYRFGNLRAETLKACDDPEKPEVVYFDARWTPGQLASLYTACDCSVMPYRGEGFGLTILEAMACGLPVIVPRGGASDDFVTEATGFLLDSRIITTEHEWPLVGPALELEIDIAHLRSSMRHAFENRELVAEKGAAAARRVSTNFTWENTFNLMARRVMEIVATSGVLGRMPGIFRKAGHGITACVRTQNHERQIANCLSRLIPFVDEVLVVDTGSTDRTIAISREYGAKVIAGGICSRDDDQSTPTEVYDALQTSWFFWLTPEVLLDDADASQIRGLIEAQPERTAEVTMQMRNLNNGVSADRATYRLKLIRARCDN